MNIQTPAKEAQPLQTSPIYSNVERVTQSYNVIQTPDDAGDFYVRIRATSLRRIRLQLRQLSSGDFPWAELLLAISTTSLGGTLGALAGGVKLDASLISITCYVVLPCAFVGTLVGWWALRDSLLVNAKSLATTILSELPEDDSLKSSEESSKKVLLGVVEIDEGVEEKTELATSAIEEDSIDNLLPADDWTERTYDLAYSIRVAHETSTLIDEAFKKSQIKNEQDALRWEGWKLYCRINFASKSEEFLELRELANNNKHNSFLNKYVARLYQARGDHIQAAFYFQRAASVAPSSWEYIANQANAALERWKGGDKEIAEILSKEVRSYKAVTTIQRLAQLEGERKFLEVSNDKERLVGILEKTLEIDPFNHEDRFALAFAYGELGRHRLAILHYQRIPLLERQPNAWNNLGVSFNELDMRCLSIEAFEKAVEHESSLAHSNLANNYVDAGFISKARQLLDKESLSPSRHENIDRSLVRIRDAQDKEEKTLVEVEKKAQELSAFMRGFGESIYSNVPAPIDGKFEAIGMTLDINVKDNEINATGNYILNSLGLRLGAENATHQPFKLNASLRGASAVGYIKKTSATSPTSAASILTEAANFIHINLFVSPDGDRIDLLEIPSEGGSKLVTFLRKSPEVVMQG